MNKEDINDFIEYTEKLFAKLDYIQSKRSKVRKAIDNYNKRVAKHLAFQLGYPTEEIYELICDMEDNNEVDYKW